MAQTQALRRTETRRRLLAAATELFAKNGYHATSVDSVAEHAERTTGALYDHVGGKSGLLVALLDDRTARTVANLTAGLAHVPDLDGRLGALWSGMSDRGGSDGSWLLLEFELWLHAVRDPEIGDIGAVRFARMRTGLADALAEWEAELQFGLPAPADEVATQLIALLLGMAFQHRLEPARVPSSAVLGGLKRILDLPVESDGAAA